jgi:hypothetical protein
MDRQGWQRPVGGRGHGRGAGAEPSVGDGRAGQDHQEWRRLATRGGRSPIGLWPRHGRGTSANVALLSALAAFAVPAAFGVAQALPAVESESASPGLGHRGLHSHEPYRLDGGNCRSMRASPSRLVAYIDPWLRAATSPGRAEKLAQPAVAMATTTRTTRSQERSHLDQAMRRAGWAKHVSVPLRPH